MNIIIGKSYYSTKYPNAYTIIFEYEYNTYRVIEYNTTKDGLVAIVNEPKNKMDLEQNKIWMESLELL